MSTTTGLATPAEATSPLWAGQARHVRHERLPIARRDCDVEAIDAVLIEHARVVGRRIATVGLVVGPGVKNRCRDTNDEDDRERPHATWGPSAGTPAAPALLPPAIHKGSYSGLRKFK